MRCTGEHAPVPAADLALPPDVGVDSAAAIGPGLDPTLAPVPSGNSEPRALFLVRGEHTEKDSMPTSVGPSEVVLTTVPSGESKQRTPFPLRVEHASKARVPVCGDLVPVTPVPVCGELVLEIFDFICGDSGRKTTERSSEVPSLISSKAPSRGASTRKTAERTSEVPGPGPTSSKVSVQDAERAPTTDPIPVGGESQVNLDLLSTLTDDLLLLVLARLPFDEAVRTCVLAHRWRSLWTQLRTLVFREDPAAQPRRFQDLVHGALTRHAGCSLDSLFIEVIHRPGTNVAGITTWLRGAAARVTGTLSLSISPWHNLDDQTMVLGIPCFQKAKEIVLCPLFAEIRLATCSFRRLVRLVLVGARFTQAGADLGAVVSTCCPSLKILELSTLFGVPVLRIHCNVLLELRLGWIEDLAELEVVAPELIKMILLECATSFDEKPAIINAPKLEVLDWRTLCPGEVKISGCKLRKFRMSLDYIEHTSCLLGDFTFIGCIDIVIGSEMSRETVKKQIEEYRLPNHHELLLSLEPNRAEFGETIDIPDEESGLMDLKDTKRS